MLLPTLAAAQSKAAGRQPSAAFRHEDLPVRDGPRSKSRQILNGETHSGFLLDLHSTELKAGEAPHARRKHIHEEMVLISSGLLEVTILDKVTRVGPGSVVYVASNEEHGWKNVGDQPGIYFVLALGKDA